jgi:divalent metal cation (Fe/Co/Zn/Cd) transporter
MAIRATNRLLARCRRFPGQEARMTRADRQERTSGASRWCALSVGWAALVGTCSFVAGLGASSNALVAFGASSLLDGTASGILVWRFRRERSGADVEAIERRAASAVGVVMAAVALYLAFRSVKALTDESGPERSTVGVALTAASAIVLPVLARAKLRLAALLSSPGLRGDGVLSLAGAMLAFATLLSLVVDAALGWWWADSVAACLIATLLLVEGVRTATSARSPARSA